MLLLVVLASARVTPAGAGGLPVWVASGVGLTCADLQGFVGS
jgi:hypothetical protein